MGSQRLALGLIVASLALAGLSPTAEAQIGPDVIVWNLGAIARDGNVGDITAFSTATTSCNIGDQVAIWIAGNNQHPVIAQNMYRLKDGRFEQIGQSWLKHGFCAVNEPGCGNCQDTPCSTLGLGCADTYSTFLNGEQANLGPRFDVNAATGEFNYPFPTQGQSGNPIFKRLQVHNEDLDPALNGGASYFVEAHYITTDEPSWGTQYNNVSYRPAGVIGSGNFFSVLYNQGPTVVESVALQAWKDADPDVIIETVWVPEGTDGQGNPIPDGQLQLAYRVTLLPTGLFHYEYALYNMNSHRSVGSFEIALPDGVDLFIENAGFNDVDYHSGEPFTNLDWEITQASDGLTWATETFTENPDANALRWSTMYNFRFDSEAPPVMGDATIGFFRPAPGVEDSTTLQVLVPAADFVPVPTNVTCAFDPFDPSVVLEWQNNDTYDTVEIRRDGQLIASLPGDSTSYVDANTLPGDYVYSVTGVQGAESSASFTCALNIPVEPDLAFILVGPETEIFYNPITGLGSGSAGVRMVEDDQNPGFPSGIAGFSLSVAHEDQYLAVDAVEASAALEELNGGSGPDFFSPSLFGSGYTVGMVVSFPGTDTLVVDGLTEVVSADYSTVDLNLAGDGVGLTTVIDFPDGVFGDIPVSNVVVVGVVGRSPYHVDGEIQLVPLVGGFVRGDDNGDGVHDLADPIYNLNFLVEDGPSVCLDAMDTNDDGTVDISDVIYNLTYLYQGGAPPPAPFPSCGPDGTPDQGGDLGCENSVSGCP